MKKRKLNSRNPKYNLSTKEEKKIKVKKLICNAIIRTSSGKDSGKTAAIHGIWYEK